MGRDSLPRRILVASSFIFICLWCLLFKDLPRLLFLRRKKIENQVVVITGGAMGIGKAVAKQLAIQEKAKLCILDVNEKEGLRTVDEITENGGTAYFFRCDVSDPESLNSIAAEIRSDPKLGPVNICIVNAAVLRFGECMELSDDDFRINSDVNILGHIYTIRAFLPDMLAAKKGQIVSMGSICSYFGEHYGTAYCSAKFACRGFIEALQMELMAKGLYHKIPITSIYPYFVRTGFIEQLDEPYSTFFDVVPIERCCNEVVDAVLKERLCHFIPGSTALLCIYLKCLVTKATLPAGRKLFNFTYRRREPHQKITVQDV